MYRNVHPSSIPVKDWTSEPFRAVISGGAYGMPLVVEIVREGPYGTTVYAKHPVPDQTLAQAEAIRAAVTLQPRYSEYV